VRSDVSAWLGTTKERFDLILLDPPSFSNSKKTDQSFDVQRDQVSLVQAAMAVLEPSGVLYFSNNRRGFKLDDTLAEAYEVRDISAQTLDPDFERNPKIHQAWKLRHRGS
jgi:23S rRNA (guanine2445-N2)-methyltransferase / 23S rRNA (guanine2069-N7)-methyltransferase